VAAGSVAAFWAVALLLIVVPGPDWAFVLGSGLRGRTALPAVAGLVLGYALVTVVVAAGAGALIARSPRILTGLTVIGGGYLMWHGIRTLSRPGAPPRPARPGPQRCTARGTLAQGTGVSALNPKGLLIFLALLPQFTSPHGPWPAAVQLAFLGLVFMTTAGAFYLCLGSVARKILAERPAALNLVTRLSGAAMAVVGAVLLTARLLG
jgi:threonine/homoserine/homoserine lactone efflux protein